MQNVCEVKAAGQIWAHCLLQFVLTLADMQGLEVKQSEPPNMMQQ